MTPRRFSAALALVIQDENERDARAAVAIRAAHHADGKGFEEYLGSLLDE
jgi:hypothetical protein